MAIGRNFTEALGKALRSTGDIRRGILDRADPELDERDLADAVRVPTDGRIYRVEQAAARGLERRAGVSAIAYRPVVRRPDRPAGRAPGGTRRARLPSRRPCCARRNGTACRTAQLAALRPELAGEDGVRAVALARRNPPGLQDGRHLRRRVRRAHAVPLLVPTTRKPRSESRRSRTRPKVIILGSGPNRIGQGIEFDYSCVHAVMALRERGLRDRDGQLQPGDGLDRLRHRRPAVLRAAHLRGRPRGRPRRARVRPSCRSHRARLGGQTPLGLAAAADGLRACPSSAPSRRRSTWPRIAARSASVLEAAGLPSAARTAPRRRSRRRRRWPIRIGYPVLVRPSYVLGGRGMEIVYDEDDARRVHRAGHRGEPGSSRSSSTGSSTTRSRSTSTRCSTAREPCTSAA